MPCSAGPSQPNARRPVLVRYRVHDLLESAEAALCGGRAPTTGRCFCFGQRRGSWLSEQTALGVDWWASARAAVIISPLWFLAQETYNWSLEGVSVSVSTVLSTTSCVFTLALSVLVLGERMTWLKGVGVGLTVLGGLAVASERWGIGLDRPLPAGGRHSRTHQEGGEALGGEGEEGGPTNTVWGILVCLASAALYGVYTVAIRIGVPDEDGGGEGATEGSEAEGPSRRDSQLSGGGIGSGGGLQLVAAAPAGSAPGLAGVSVSELGRGKQGAAWDGRHEDPVPAGEGGGEGGTVPLPVFFGLLGAFNLLALLPVVLLLHVLRVEPLDGRVARALGLVVLKGLLDNVLADFLWARAIALTTPTVATVGLSLTIPMAMGSDWVMHGAPSVGLLLGALLVIGGFLAINFGGGEGEEGEEGREAENAGSAPEVQKAGSGDGEAAGAAGGAQVDGAGTDLSPA